ncbi:carbon storage regulator [bacterium]|nr:carbon storage regulator [bacterium]
MFVLTLKKSEKILLSRGAISITVLDAGNNCVRLGINAPNHVDIVRPKSRKADHAVKVNNGLERPVI